MKPINCSHLPKQLHDFQIIVKCLHNLIAAKMESSPDDAAVKDMLREWAGEDVEMVLDEMRKLRLIERVVRGRQITDRMHEIPKDDLISR